MMLILDKMSPMALEPHSVVFPEDLEKGNILSRTSVVMSRPFYLQRESTGSNMVPPGDLEQDCRICNRYLMVKICEWTS